MSYTAPFPISSFLDVDGKPLENGYVWIGVAGSDPVANPISVYWDDAATQLATQPIRTIGGYPSNAGVRSRLYISATDYSVKVTNVNGAETVPVSLYNATEVSATDVNFLQAGSGAVVRTAQAKMRDVVSVKDFGAVGDGVADDTVAIQAAITYAATRSLVGGTVYLPPGSYKTTSTIYTYGAGGVGQVALVGDGIFSTRFVPSGDFTVINLISSYVESGGFSIEWPVTAAGSIPATRIGIEIAGANNQFSYATLKNVTVTYGYRGFVMNNWTGQPLGTAYLCTLQQLTAFRCADWGFYLNSKTGSTTLRMNHCYVRGDNSSGGAQYGKGIYINNFNDIYTEQLAIDQCLNSWIEFVNYNVCVMNGIALESNKMSSAASVAVYFNGAQTVVNGFKDLSCTYDTSGNARVIYAGAICTLALSGYNEQSSTVVAGTTKYRVAFNAVGTQISILDRTVVPSQVLDNGWFANTVYQGIRRSSVGSAPNYGTWLRGDYVTNGASSVGQPKGWYCTVAGSPGTWVSEGNL